MPIDHILRPGETLLAIAQLYGFRAWETIAEAPENQDLIAQRKSPHSLEPGDVVRIPDPQVGAREYETGTVHRSVVRTSKQLLEIRVYTELRRVPEGVAPGAKNDTIRGWLLGKKAPPLPVRAASISLGPVGARSGQTDRRGRLRVEALTDGEWKLRLQPHADETSPGPAMPDDTRDHGLDWGAGNIPRSMAGREGRKYEIEYRPLELMISVRDGEISGVDVASLRPDDRPYHATCFWRDGVEPGEKGVTQVLEIDLKPDFLRRLYSSQVRPVTKRRGTGPKPELFQIHHTGGNLISGAIAQFTLENLKSGIHFLNDRDGHVIRMSDDRYRVRHGGGQRGSVECAWADRGRINDRAMGVENVHGGEAEFTAAQIRSLIGLVRRAMKLYGIPINNVIGHGDVYTGKARTCPSKMFPWKTLEDAGVAVKPLPLSAADVASMFGGYFEGEAGRSRVLREGDLDRGDEDGTTSLVRGGKVIASGQPTGPVVLLHDYLHEIGYVPNRDGRKASTMEYAEWRRERPEARVFGRGTKASVQLFKGHYCGIDRPAATDAPIVDVATAKLIFACYRFAALLPKLPPKG